MTAPSKIPISITPSLDAMNYARFLQALIVWREAGSAAPEVMRGVVHVIQNRVMDPAFPDTLIEVLSQPRQFTTWFSCEYPDVKGPTFKQFQRAWDLVYHPGEDNTYGATYFHSLQVDIPMRMALEPLEVSVKIGRMTFLRRKKEE